MVQKVSEHPSLRICCYIEDTEREKGTITKVPKYSIFQSFQEKSDNYIKLIPFLNFYAAAAIFLCKTYHISVHKEDS